MRFKTVDSEDRGCENGQANWKPVHLVWSNDTAWRRAGFNLEQFDKAK